MASVLETLAIFVVAMAAVWFIIAQAYGIFDRNREAGTRGRRKKFRLNWIRCLVPG